MFDTIIVKPRELERSYQQPAFWVGPWTYDVDVERRAVFNAPVLMRRIIFDMREAERERPATVVPPAAQKLDRRPVPPVLEFPRDTPGASSSFSGPAVASQIATVAKR